MYSATFDVSRISEISVTAYLRSSHPGMDKSKQEGGGGQGEDMGNSDLCMGGIRFTPDLETGVRSLYLFPQM